MQLQRRKPGAAYRLIWRDQLSRECDFRRETGVQVGVKAAGGIRASKDALRYLVAVSEVAGGDWLDPAWFRFGASSLLNDVLMQIEFQRSGHYSDPDDFTLD